METSIFVPRSAASKRPTDLGGVITPPGNVEDPSTGYSSDCSQSNVSFISNFSLASSVGSQYSFSRADSNYRHSTLINNWKNKLTEHDESLPSLRMALGDLSEGQIDSFYEISTEEPPFYFPFDMYELLEKNQIDDLVIKLKKFVEESQHTSEEWATVLKWNNYELLRILSTRVEFVSESSFDKLVESILLFLEIDEKKFAPPLVTSAFMNRLFSSLTSEAALSLLKRLKVLYIIFNFGGLAFPDISFQNCQYLLSLCTHQHAQVRVSALNTSIIGYYRMSSEFLWKELQGVLPFECIKAIIDQSLLILSEEGDKYDAIHVEGALEWLGSCFLYKPTMYYNIYNFHATLDVLLVNLQRYFDLGQEDLLCSHIECVRKIIDWSPFFEANYRVKEVMTKLNDLMKEAGKENFTKVCEIISQIYNDHLEHFPQEDEFGADDGDCVVFE